MGDNRRGQPTEDKKGGKRVSEAYILKQVVVKDNPGKSLMLEMCWRRRVEGWQAERLLIVSY